MGKTMTIEKNMEEDDFTFDLESLDDLQASNSAFLKKRIIFWLFRWLIGFSIIGGVVHYKPSLFWLWWVGLAVFILIPIMAIVSAVLLRKKSTAIRLRAEKIRDDVDCNEERDYS